MHLLGMKAAFKVLSRSLLVSGVGFQAPGYWLLASCCWLLVTEFKILGMNHGIGNLGAYNRKLATAGQGQETSSQGPVASDGQNADT